MQRKMEFYVLFRVSWKLLRGRWFLFFGDFFGKGGNFFGEGTNYRGVYFYREYFMFKLLNPKNGKIGMVFGIVALFGVGGLDVATAESKNASKPYKVCLNNFTGKIIAKRKCTAVETALDAESFTAFLPTATGVAGKDGQTGAQGPVGPVGATGAQGLTGAKGEKGDKGDQGLVGPIGPVGPVGIQGIPGPLGLMGPGGPMGPVGPVGPRGAAGTAGFEIVSTEFTLGGGLFGSTYVLCPAGKIVTGGGAYPTRGHRKLIMNSSAPTMSAGTYGWSASFSNTDSDTGKFAVYAICMLAN